VQSIFPYHFIQSHKIKKNYFDQNLKKKNPCTLIINSKNIFMKFASKENEFLNYSNFNINTENDQDLQLQCHK
jgi:hypothetical protein